MADLIVCGGGAIGLSIAYEAANRCGWSVTILETKRIGSGSSWAGAGILPPGSRLPALDPIDQLRAASHAMFPAWCNQIEKLSGLDVGFLRCGGVYLARSHGELATLSANEAWWADQGIAFERWDRPQWTSQLPYLNAIDSLKKVWYLPEECQVRNPRYIKSLMSCCQKLGVKICEEEGMVEVQQGPLPHKKEALRVLTSRGEYAASRVCVTTGAWTRNLLQDFVSPSCTPEIYPVRGQMVLFRLPEALFTPVINDGHRYLVPRADGYVLAGSCEEEVGFDSSTTVAMIDELKSWAIELVPMLKYATVENTWAGLRPASIDGFPYLGEIPGMPSVYIAAGHYRHGIHFSPITAKLMVDLMNEETPSIDMRPFQIGRGSSYSQ